MSSQHHRCERRVPQSSHYRDKGDSRVSTATHHVADVPRQGDNFNLNVLNLLKDTDLDTVTSIVSLDSLVLIKRLLIVRQHWHGLFQRGSVRSLQFVTSKCTLTCASGARRWASLRSTGTSQSENIHTCAYSISQCPIVPLESFDYKFSVPDQAGTVRSASFPCLSRNSCAPVLVPQSLQATVLPGPARTHCHIRWVLTWC